MAKMQKRNLLSPDETRTFDQGKLELVTIGGDYLWSRHLPAGVALGHFGQTAGEYEKL